MMKHLKSILVAIMAVVGMAAPVASWAHTADNRVIYEVFVRNFSPAGNLKGVEAQIPRLKELGVDVVWLMPIYLPGQTDRWGTYASPYCVKDHKAIDPFYGTAQDLHDLVDAIHANGMEIWLDWVANHTSTDHVWLADHSKDWYVWEGNSIKHPYGWTDVIQLNFNNSAMRAAMIDAMKYWVTEFDIDGFRCDYADGVPRSFWRDARQEVNAIKDVAWLAESAGAGNNALLVKETFDYDYAWGFNSHLREFGSSSDASSIANAVWNLHYGSQASNYEGKSRMVYLSNHDCVQDQGGTEDRAWSDNLKVMTVLSFTCYGMPLIYNGQEVKYSHGQVLLSEKTPINWSGDASMTALLRTLCRIKHDNAALNTGVANSLVNHTTNKGNIYVFERRNGESRVVVMLNFGSSATTFNVNTSLPAATFTEAFTGVEVDMATQRTFTLPGYGYAVYTTSHYEGSDEPEVTSSDTRHHIYLTDNTGWSDVRLYGWESGQAELFGGWPGASANPILTVGREKVYVYPYEHDFDGKQYNLIVHNGQGTQYDMAAATLDGDLYYDITSTRATEREAYHRIYVRNLTGWPSASLRLYCWNDRDTTLYGSWPGTAVHYTTTIDDTAYCVFLVPRAGEGDTYNLIFSNNGTNQLHDIELTLDRDRYIAIDEKGLCGVDASVEDFGDEEPEYYNLQGMRVERPGTGIYIVRRGSRTYKVRL